jgi:hypothetical protein
MDQAPETKDQVDVGMRNVRGERPLELLLPRATKHSQRWMTVRPQHHRQPPPRRRRHWRRLLYPFLYFVYFFGLDIIRQNRFQQPVQFSVGSLYGFPTTVVLLSSTSPYRCLFLSTLPPLSEATLGARHSCHISQRSNFQRSPPSSLFPCRRSHSPVTPTTITQPDVPLSRISLAVTGYGPQQRTHQHSHWRRDHGQWCHRQPGLGWWTLARSRWW